MSTAERIHAHLNGEPTHEDHRGKHYPPCPGCDTTRWHHAGCTLQQLCDEHRDELYALITGAHTAHQELLELVGPLPEPMPRP